MDQSDLSDYSKAENSSKHISISQGQKHIKTFYSNRRTKKKNHTNNFSLTTIYENRLNGSNTSSKMLKEIYQSKIFADKLEQINDENEKVQQQLKQKKKKKMSNKLINILGGKIKKKRNRMKVTRCQTVQKTRLTSNNYSKTN